MSTDGTKALIAPTAILVLMLCVLVEALWQPLPPPWGVSKETAESAATPLWAGRAAATDIRRCRPSDARINSFDTNCGSDPWVWVFGFNPAPSPGDPMCFDRKGRRVQAPAVRPEVIVGHSTGRAMNYELAPICPSGTTGDPVPGPMGPGAPG